MSSNSVKVKQTLNAREFMREMLKVLNSIDKATSRLDRMGRAGQRAGRKSQQGFGQAFRTFSRFATAVAGFSGVLGGTLVIVNQLRREYDNLISRQREGGDTRVKYEDTLNKAVQKTRGMMSAQELAELARKFSDSTDQQVSETRVLEVLSAAVSARGAKNRADVMMATETALSALMLSPHSSDEEAARLGTTATSLGARWGMSGRETLALMQGVFARSNVENMEMLAKNIAPTMMQATQFGINPHESAAMISAISQGMGDVTGEISATAMVNMVRSLEERFRHAPGGFDLENSIKYLRNNPDKMRQFFEGGTFFGHSVGGAKLTEGITDEQFGKAQIGKGKALPTLMEILRKNTEGQSQYDAFLRDFISMNLEQEYQNSVTEIKRNSPVSGTRRAMGTATQTAQIHQPREAMSGVLREGLERYYKAQGYANIEQRVNTMMNDFLSGGRINPNTIVGELAEEANDLLAPEYYGGFPPSRPAAWLPGPPGRRPPSQEDISLARELTRLATSLDKILEKSNFGEAQAREPGGPVEKEETRNPQLDEAISELKRISRNQTRDEGARKPTKPPSKKLSGRPR